MIQRYVEKGWSDAVTTGALITRNAIYRFLLMTGDSQWARSNQSNRPVAVERPGVTARSQNIYWQKHKSKDRGRAEATHKITLHLHDKVRGCSIDWVWSWLEVKMMERERERERASLKFKAYD